MHHEMVINMRFCIHVEHIINKYAIQIT